MTYNHRVILRTVAVVLLFEGLFMLIPLVFALFCDESGAAKAFAITAAGCILIGGTIFKSVKYNTLKIKIRESYFIALSCWIEVCLVGTLPYLLSGGGYSYVDCFFESVSGWTTTGAWSININELPRSLILWKGISNWLGGLGLLLLTTSVFPVLGVQGQKMVAAELPGPELEKMSARFSDTAKLTYSIYIALSLAEFLLLLPSELDIFAAATNTMSTISTAGLLDYQGQVSGHFTPYVKIIFSIFSVAGSLNFMVYFLLCTGKWKLALKNLELRVFLLLLAAGSLLVAGMLLISGTYDTASEALLDAATQTIAFGATSGFEVGDINAWPTACKMILLILLLIGGCANSTSGSIKVIRFIVFMKLIRRGLYKRIHPRAIRPIMIQGRPISAAGASSITVFLMLYFAILIFSFIVLALENQDMETTLCTAVAAITNNGTCFGGIIGGNFSIFSAFGKVYSALLMLTGRLELYAVLILFSRSFWNSDRARS